MSRFSSLKHVPAETRQILRDRFSSKLHVPRYNRLIAQDLEVLKDEHTLELLTNIKVLSDAEFTSAESAYLEAKPSESEPPDIQTLIEQGWLRLIWGRVKISQELRMAMYNVPAGNMDALNVLLSNIYHYKYKIDKETSLIPELTQLAESLEHSHAEVYHINCRTPIWVSSRLWENILEQEATPDIALRRWMDLWEMLQCPAFVLTSVWSSKDANLFKESALRVISENSGLDNWINTIETYVKQHKLIKNINQNYYSYDLSPPTDNLVSKALWVQSRTMENNYYESLVIGGEIFGLMRVLLADAIALDNSSAPNAIVTQIVDLAIDLPELLIALLFEVNRNPRLLADLVIYPPSSGLACLLIAQWKSNAGAWDRGIVERDHKVGLLDSFADATSIFSEHIIAGKSNISEAAELFVWLHSQAGAGFIDDLREEDVLLTSLGNELSNFTKTTLLSMIQSINKEELYKGIGTFEFSSALDICSLGGIEYDVDASLIITAYAESIKRGEYSLSAHRIGIKGAAALARIAGQNDELIKQFLYPVDVRLRLTEDSSKENEFILADSIGRSLRTHIRILCRAVIGGTEDIVAYIFDALITAVQTGALQHKEKGRIAAFSPRFEEKMGVPSYDRPIAVDLAATLTSVNQHRQKALLSAILETDEPLILAQLLPISPPSLRADIEQRIIKIAPDDSGAIHSLPEMLARIDELLTAGATEAAARYMETEIKLKTWGKPLGRELTRFQNELRLHFLRKDWDAITNIKIPEFFAQNEKNIAIENLKNFQALVALKGPTLNPEWAKNIFIELFKKRPSLSFITNWFAAEIISLTQSDSFDLLSGEEIKRGKKAIENVKKMLKQLPEITSDEALECNMALLLLALSEPGQALDILSSKSFIRLQDTASAYKAVALSRLGRPSEATATLDHAELIFGRTSLITSVRSHIASGSPYLYFPTVSIYENLNENVGSAIARFRTMNPSDQARVFLSQQDPLQALLVDQVRAAGDSVVSLVPMMKGVKIDTIEDDLTAFIQHVLAARVHFFGWSVGDQSKGGFSAIGNAGERDLLVTWGSSILAVIEAIVCNKPLTQDSMKADLESHFQKLLGYGTPRLFFHLTYAYIEDKEGLMRTLEICSETANPPGFTYIDREPIPHDDSRPTGFVARYQADVGEIKVIFLVLNMGQQRQRLAAKTAAETKRRKAPKKNKTE